MPTLDTISVFHLFSRVCFTGFTRTTSHDKYSLQQNKFAPVFLFSAGHLEPHVLPAVVLRPDARRSGARYHGGAVRHDGPDCEHDERHPAGPPDGAFDHGQPDGGGNEADGGVHQRVHDAVNTQDHELDGRHR
jgi:hypothetical protein